MSDFIHSASKVFLSSNAANAARNFGSAASYTFTIQPLIISNTDESQFVIGLESASVPLSFYVVNATNNQFLLDGITITIAQGNYSISALITQLNAQLLANGFVATTYFGYNANSNKLYINRASGVSTFTSVANNAKKLMGYLDQTYTNGEEFSNIVNLTYTTGITFRIDNLTTSNRDASADGGSCNLSRIPITTPAYTILQFFNNQPFYTTLKTKVINQISVSLIDDDGNLLNFNGSPNWFVTLRIDYKVPQGLNGGTTAIQDMRQEAFQPYQEEQQAMLEEAMNSTDTAPPEYQATPMPVKRITKPDYIQLGLERRLAKQENDMGMERPLILQKKIRRNKK
jgi:hypothetical protein